MRELIEQLQGGGTVVIYLAIGNRCIILDFEFVALALYATLH